MAQFTNQAQLTYRGETVVSNVVTGELTDPLSVTKTALQSQYQQTDTVTYVISLINEGTAPITDVQVTDDLGAVTLPEGVVRQLTYVTGSLRLFSDGVPQTEPVPAEEAPLTVTGLTVPAEGELLLIYEAAVSSFASPEQGATIVNTVTVTSPGAAPRTAQATLTAAQEAALSLLKSMSPVTVAPGEQLTYTLRLQNAGNTPAGETDALILTDTFDPALTDLTVLLDGTELTAAQYTYDPATGAFATVEGVLAVQAATFTQDASGAWIIVPGETVLTVTGTV